MLFHGIAKSFLPLVYRSSFFSRHAPYDRARKGRLPVCAQDGGVGGGGTGVYVGRGVAHNLVQRPPLAHERNQNVNNFLV